jgi:predicted DNA-binding protein
VNIHQTMSKYTAFRCPEELLEKAKAKAQRDRRSLSNYLITLIEKDVGAEPSADFSSGGSKAKSAARRPQTQKSR